ncbi:MAG: phage baseplate protein [Plesiomonas shigelloides]
MAFIFNPGILGKLFGQRMSALQAIQIDVTNEQEVTRTFQVTTKPVEDGSVIADNIIEEPVIIRMDCMMKGSLFESWEDKMAAINMLASSREPFDVTTRFGVYSNMFFTELPFITNHQYNNVLKFSCTLMQIPIVSSVTTEIPADAQKGADGKKKQAPAVDKGKVQGEKVPESDSGRRASWASSMSGWGA